MAQIGNGMIKFKPLSLLCLLTIVNLSAIAQGVRDTALVGKIISMDETPIKITHDKRGYIFHFGFYHVDIESGSDTIHLVKVFDAHTDMILYRNRFNYKIGENRGFVVYKFNPCACEMPRMNGYCEGGLFYPLHSKLSPYNSVYRILVDYLPITDRDEKKKKG